MRSSGSKLLIINLLFVAAFFHLIDSRSSKSLYRYWISAQMVERPNVGEVDWINDPGLPLERLKIEQRLDEASQTKSAVFSYEKAPKHGIHSSATNVSKPNSALFYNRIPKCGSSTALKIMRRMAEVNRFKLIEDTDYAAPFGKTRQYALNLTRYFLQLRHPTWAYQSHSYYFSLNDFKIPWQYQPNLINIMREPLDHFGSAVYFFFTDKLRKNNSADLDLERCIEENQRICQYMTQACFFSGTCKACVVSDPSLEQIAQMVQLAKFHIETEYSVVGLTHHLKLTFALFEKYLPKFFRGAVELYSELEKWEKDRFNVMVNHSRPKMSDKVKVMLLSKPLVAADIEVYSFVLQRFSKQLMAQISTSKY